MKRISFLVAAMAATATAPVLAQQTPDPGRMFLINAVTPGVVSFSGEGTAQFNTQMGAIASQGQHLSSL